MDYWFFFKIKPTNQQIMKMIRVVVERIMQFISTHLISTIVIPVYRIQAGGISYIVGKAGL